MISDYVNIIASGSDGNCTIIKNSIAVDIGIPFSKLRPFHRDLKLVLLTHEHQDHFNARTVRKLSSLRPSLRFACCEWMVPFLIGAEVPKQNIDVMEPDLWNYYKGIEGSISPFRTLHNVPNCGWRILLEKTTPCNSHATKILYATDLSTLDGIEAKNYDLYMIECNHREAEIEAKIAEKTAAGEFSYEVEAARNHLSWEQAMDWLSDNGPSGWFIPMHQHMEKER